MRGRVPVSSTQAMSLCSLSKRPSFWVPVASLRATRLPNLYIMESLVVWLSYSICLIAYALAVWSERSTSAVRALRSLFKTRRLTSYA
jgi:hypothetical protein